MPDKFRIYSTDAAPTLTPDTAWILPYDDTGADNVLFVVGETVTGAGGATGTVLSVTGTATAGILVLALTNATSFVDGEVLTGSTAGIADVDSVTGGTAPSTLIVFDQDPYFGSYETANTGDDRGSTLQTLGGVVVQDLGIVTADEVISFSDTDALPLATVTALQTAYETIDGEWYFTDGYECWKVQFSRSPRGFVKKRNLLFANKDQMWFSYDIKLLVLSKEI